MSCDKHGPKLIYDTDGNASGRGKEQDHKPLRKLRKRGIDMSGYDPAPCIKLCGADGTKRCNDPFIAFGKFSKDCPHYQSWVKRYREDSAKRVKEIDAIKRLKIK